MDLLYTSFARLGGDRLAWRLTANRLRILCYHGVCDDRLANEPWVPSYFVTRSAFDLQLRYLRRHAHVLPLSEALQRLRAGSLPPRAVSLTFDDGYANNVELGLPILERHGLPATIYLATAYIETGDWYPFLKLKLVRARFSGVFLPDYKSSPVDTVRSATDQYWRETEAGLTAAHRDTLRPLTVDEVRRVGSPLVEFGAHSHTHPIARNEQPERRREEVQTSVRRVAEWTGRPVQSYSYPNGEAGDFGEPEKAALSAAGVHAAVTGIAGSNRAAADYFALRRYPLTLNHDDARFRAEATGFRSAVLSLAPSR